MLQSIVTRWARAVCRHPGKIVALFLALSLAGGYLASNIKIKSSFSHLLPDHTQSVIDLKNISARMGGMGTLIVMVEGKNLPAMQKLADAIAQKLRSYPREEVLFVDYKVDAPKAFYEKNKYLFLSKDELLEFQQKAEDYVLEKKKKANPFYVDLEEGNGGGDKDGSAELDFEGTKKKYASYLDKFKNYKDGYLTNERGDQLIIVIKTQGEATGVDFAVSLCAKVEADIAALKPSSYDPSLRVSLTGELKTLPEEYEALRNDILVVSNLAVVLVLLVTAMYFRSVRMTVVMSVGLVAAVLTTFGIVYLRIGYLTAATAFLSSIVSGNGINFGIYFLARYNEERAKSADIESVIAKTLHSTVISVSIAALASGTAYASLMATQFKGFNQFGFIGGVGMVVCLLFALTFVPALTVLWDRRRPLQPAPLESAAGKPGKSRFGAAFSRIVFGRWTTRFFVWAVGRHARIVAVVGIVAVVASIAIVAAFRQDPFEYNFRNLRNQTSDTKGSGDKSIDADDILGTRSSPLIVLADRVDQVPEIVEKLMRFHISNPDPTKQAIKRIQTIFDLIPGSDAEQKEKIAILSEIRKLLVDNIDLADEKKRDEIRANLPPEDLAPITIDSIPEELTRPYTELNGTKGNLVLIYQNGSVWRKEAIERISRAIREIRLDSNEVIRSSGTVVIFNDILAFLSNEGPRAVITSFLAVLVIVALAFRNARDILVVGGSMAASVALMLGLAVALDQKLNFLNFIAIPIQFGIGVDYSANIYSRFKEEGPGSIVRVLRSTGGAAMLCSLTTIIGFGAMWFSMNGAINTLATLANIGEVTCIATASLFMPAFLVLFCKGLGARR